MMHNLLPGKNKSHLTIKEALLPQPPSFSKKKNYEIHAKLGEGTFGKVMVSVQEFIGPAMLGIYVAWRGRSYSAPLALEM